MYKKLLGTKSAHDIVVLGAYRTPIGKSLKGKFRQTYPEELLQQVIKGTMDRTGLEMLAVDDVLVGTALQSLGGQKASSIAVKSLGFPVTTTINTINRQCSLSAQAATYVANSIRAGDYDVGIAAGVESMTFDYFPHRAIPQRISPFLLSEANQEAKDVLMSMGQTSENVAKKYSILRQDQDEFALRSHQNAAAATLSGHFSKEIIPVQARIPLEDKSEEFQIEVVKQDEGFRSNISIEKLGSLKPVFDEQGFTTAGNASQISDGASAVILTSRQKAEELGIKPIARYIAASVAGVPANLMGIGPVHAIPNLLNKLGLSTKDIDLWELNEAFASQSLYVVNELDLPMHKVNKYGGAIALGHPLGATGARCIATLLNGLEDSDGKLGVVSMCTSTGQGYAAVFEKE